MVTAQIGLQAMQQADRPVTRRKADGGRRKG
jgi:hypothetical protein